MIELENHHFAIPKGIIDSTKDHQWTIEERLIGNQIYLVSKYYLLHPPPTSWGKHVGHQAMWNKPKISPSLQK